MNCAQHTDTPAVAYCRTCGKALCESCKRVVSSAIYCESCIANRMGAGASAATSSQHVAMAPLPVLAGFLGMIPGVGAMYNGQFIKAFIHVVIFAGIITIANHAGPADAFFGVLAAAFYFYMVFDAVLTAKARLLGQPLPDFLGLNRIFGLPEDQASAASAVSASAATTANAAEPEAAPASQAQPTVVSPPPVPNVGEPIGPIVLIALGALFLLGNLGWFHARHFWPLILIGLGFWLAYRRVGGRF